MPQDAGDEIGAPALCNHHRHSLASMAALSHVDTEVTERAARDIANQCPHCRKESK
jgi:hypothetical protein